MSARLSRRSDGPIGVYATNEGPVDILDMTKDELLAVIESLISMHNNSRAFIDQMAKLREMSP